VEQVDLPSGPEHRLSNLRRYALWPLLFGACLAVTGLATAHGHVVLGFNLCYFGLGIALFLLERRWPFERQWLSNDGQMLADFAHTALNKGAVQIGLVVSLVFGLSGGVAAGPYWPQHWPMLLQVILGLVAIEAGLYAAHRLAHELPWLWPFHAVHHSVKRLWFWNTGRFHFVDTAMKIAFGAPLMLLIGAPAEVVNWISAITAYIGMLTHCNLDVRCGVLNYVFNTPELHRWHHSRIPAEGNRNYGENLVLWDLLFGTWFLPDRRPPLDIGINTPMPASFRGQLAQPFRDLAELRKS
jgi:sterol desaturase/sphingolipid hydroxylase (fatty acid hydroxylase superfamily)